MSMWRTVVVDLRFQARGLLLLLPPPSSSSGAALRGGGAEEGGGGEEGEGEPEPAGIRDLSVDLLFGTPTHAGQCGLCGLPLRGLTRTHAQANESAR